MNETYYEHNQMALFREDFPSYKEYLQAYREACEYYGYKVRVVGGWRFFTFQQDYDLWKHTK